MKTSTLVILGIIAAGVGYTVYRWKTGAPLPWASTLPATPSAPTPPVQATDVVIPAQWAEADRALSTRVQPPLGTELTPTEYRAVTVAPLPRLS